MGFMVISLKISTGGAVYSLTVSRFGDLGNLQFGGLVVKNSQKLYRFFTGFEGSESQERRLPIPAGAGLSRILRGNLARGF